MLLCSNRPEGFGPHSTIHPNLPTTCFLEVIVIPLATWIYLVVAIIALPLLFLRYRRSRTTVSYKDGESTDSPMGKPMRTRPSLISRILDIIYYILIVAMIAMISLQIARLSTAKLGIGLLPFSYVGVLLALATHIMLPSKTARGLNMFYWLLLMVAMALLVAALAKEGSNSRNNVYPIDQYKVSDEIIDNAVMVGVEFVLLLLEMLTH